MRFMIRQFLVTAMVASVLLEARTASGAPTLEVGQMHWEGAVSSGSALQAGLRGSPDHPGRPGVDFYFNFVKDERDVAVPLDLAVGLPVGTNQLLVEPRFGGTLALGRGPFAAWGWNAGVGALIRTGDAVGLRLSFTNRWMMGDPAGVVHWTSVTAGLAFNLP